MAKNYNYNSNYVSPSYTDQYGTHYTAWCKQKYDKNGHAYLFGSVTLPNGKRVKVKYMVDVNGTNKKGEITFPIDITIANKSTYSPVSL